MRKTVTRFGVIAGIIMAVFICASVPSMKHCGEADSMLMSMFVGYTVQLLSFSLIFVAIKQYRDRYNSGVISFGRAFQTGLWISLIGSAFYVITWAIIYNTLLPDFMDNYAAAQLRGAAKHGTPPARLAAMKQELEEAKKMYNTWWGFTAYTIMEILPTGLLVSLIAALIMKRKVKKDMPVAA